jgi:putative PIN family toxin of toxin-antitoxin system
VIDTSVTLAGISGFRDRYIFGKNPSADILHRWVAKQNFSWLMTDDILDEYKEVLRRLHVRPNHIGRVINLIRARAETISPHSSIEISPDPDDDRFCLCANEGKADFLITLNLRDFPQARLHAAVVSPAEFLASR